MNRTRLVVLTLAILSVPSPASAQRPDEFPTPEEYAERAEQAERAPLFQSRDPLKITLRTDIDWLRDERNDSVEVEGTVTFIDVDGSVVVRPVDTRTRGEFRRDKRNCNFPPLRLDFPRPEMDGTVFEGQNRLKLVTPCQDGRDDYQRYVYLEYLVYEVLQSLTPLGHRVRLVEITYEDIEGDYDTRTKIGFLIESDEQMAERNRATIVDVESFPPDSLVAQQAVLTAVFNYMIGNTDWSSMMLHNHVLIRTEGGRYITVPYDFDSAGAVNARYATVAPQVANRIRRVTDRLYLGYCRPEIEREPPLELFNSRRQAIWGLYEGFPQLPSHDDDDIEDVLEFYEEFYDVINDPEEFEREIVRVCWAMPG